MGRGSIWVTVAKWDCHDVVQYHRCHSIIYDDTRKSESKAH